MTQFASDHPHAQSPQFTLDLLLSALSKSLFHPFIASLLPLCLRALAAPYTSTSFILTFVYAALVCLYHVLAILNRKLAFGPSRKIDWEDEVVVITGGCGGLGSCIAEIYAMRGVAVAVLDVDVPIEENGKEKEGVKYYWCDVGDKSEVDTVWSLLKRDLGSPTIIINTAAIIGNGPVIESRDQLEEIFHVNTLSNFYTSDILLRHLRDKRKGGTIVTISSVLGHLGAANLAAYTASKAALLAYHNSLTAELAVSTPSVKTILVAPGQLDTQLFSNIKAQGRLQRFIAPVIGAGELALQIVKMIDSGMGGEIRMPAVARWIAIMGILPMSLQQWMRFWSGLDEAMGEKRKIYINTVDEKEQYSSEESCEEDE